MRKLFLALLGGLLLPMAAWAADGDGCESGNASGTATGIADPTTRGTMKTSWCVVLCDDDSGNVSCSEYDLNNAGSADVLVFELVETGNEDCSAATATLKTFSESGLATSDTNAFDIGSTTTLAIGGTRRITLDTSQAPLDRYIRATWSGVTCTSGTLSILLYGFERAVSKQ